MTPDDMWDLVTDNQTKNVMDQFDKVWLPTVQKSKEEAMRKTPTGKVTSRPTFSRTILKFDKNCVIVFKLYFKVSIDLTLVFLNC